jgi:hypothetical protein
MEKRPWALAGPPLTTLGLGTAIRLKILGDEVNHPTANVASYVLFAISGFWAVALIVNWLWSKPKPVETGQPADKQIISHALFWLSERSAWGRWFRMQSQAHNDQEVPEQSFMHIAVMVLQTAACEGRITLWGVPTGRAGFEDVSPDLLQTRAVLSVEPDDRQLWRVNLGPYTGATPDVVAVLPKFDWLAVDMNQVKQLWPDVDPGTDKKTAKLKKKFLKRVGR